MTAGKKTHFSFISLRLKFQLILPSDFRIQPQKVLSQGFDDAAWPLQRQNSRHIGEVRLILHHANASSKSAPGFALTPPPYVASAAPCPSLYNPSCTTSLLTQPPEAPHVSPYTTLPPTVPYAPAATYPAPSPYPSYPLPPANPTAYPLSTYPPLQQATAYYPQPYPPAPYLPPPQATLHYPPGQYPGTYPPTC